MGYFSNFDDYRSFSQPPPGSPQIPFSKIDNLSAPADAPEDGRPPQSTDADMPGVNADADAASAPQAAPPVPAGGGGHAAAPSCCGATEMHHIEEEEDAEMPEVNHDAAAQPGPLPVGVGGGDGCATSSEHVKVEARRMSCSFMFMSAIERDLELEHISALRAYPSWLESYGDWSRDIPRDTPLFVIVRFTGPDSKGRKEGWKEKGMKGMRAVADPSPQTPEGRRRQQQQAYIALKKTLELDDDGNGNRWRAHEYTRLLPSDDGTNKLVPAEFSLRVEFKDPTPPPSSSSSSSKRSRSGAPKEPSEVWDHMARLNVKVTPKDGSKRKKPYYKVMYGICHHCDQVFNAAAENGTNNQSNHLKSCKCNCSHSH